MRKILKMILFSRRGISQSLKPNAIHDAEAITTIVRVIRE